MCDCSQHHEEIAAAVAEIDKKIEYHMASTHEHLVDSRTIKTWDGQILATVKELQLSHKKLADEVMGQQVEDFDGFVHRDISDGMAFQVEENTRLLKEQAKAVSRIEYQLGNGIKFRLAISDQVKVAIIAAIATLVAAYFG